MPTVDFYILKNSDASHRWFFACRLLEKAYQQGCSVFVRVETEKEASHLNQLLWTFQESSFIPHVLETQNQVSPIVIGCNDPKAADILMNFSSQIPENYPQFSRVMEIVPNTEPELAQSRTRYRTYREHGCELRTHQV